MQLEGAGVVQRGRFNIRKGKTRCRCYGWLEKVRMYGRCFNWKGKKVRRLQELRCRRGVIGV